MFHAMLNLVCCNARGNPADDVMAHHASPTQALVCIAGVQLILGLNGVVWVSAETKQSPEVANSSMDSEAQATVVREVSHDERQAIARVANCIRALAKLYFSIHPASILSVYMVRICDTCQYEWSLKPVCAAIGKVKSHASCMQS